MQGPTKGAYINCSMDSGWHTCRPRLVHNGKQSCVLSCVLHLVLVWLPGECYQEDLMFTGLPDDSLTVLALPDALILPAPAPVPVSSRPQSRLSQQDIALPGGSTITAAAAAAAAAAAQLVPTGVSSYTFGLVNESHNKHFRFKWAEHPQLKFLPSVGHIHAGRSKNITVTFTASTPTKLDGQEIKMAISQISYKVICGHRMPPRQGPDSLL